MAASHRLPAEAKPIPRYTLYDEPVRPADPRFIHVETIASRSAPRDWTIRSHAHRDLHQLLLIADGGGVMQAEAEQWRFGPASLLIAPAGLVHGYRFDPATRGHILSFADRLAHPDVAEQLASARAASIGKAALAIDRQLARLGTELTAGGALGLLAGEALLSLVLVEAARALGAGEAGRSAVPGREAALVARFRRQIEARLGEGWSVAQHALALGVSVSRLRTACASASGQAPIRMLQDRTMIEARRLLTHGTAPVSAIAYALGFADPAYFSRWFARIEGVPPGEYRRKGTQP
ncbi:helix-turn-helix domain-containing protein [Sphingomonas sp. MMS24-J13]|uniref:helix-turn-helix domain-containing protein n=1 Tax=Sphingomonas sp. MMS24-J13 TaxID=3238686 RepID=UPI00384DC7E2